MSKEMTLGTDFEVQQDHASREISHRDGPHRAVRGAVTKEAALRAAAWCDYLEAQARRCYGLLTDDGNRAALLSDVREYPSELWPCLIGFFNTEAAKYGATSGADDDNRRHCADGEKRSDCERFGSI